MNSQAHGKLYLVPTPLDFGCDEQPDIQETLPLGTLQAAEVVKEILGIGESLAGRLLICDVLASRFEVVSIPWDPDNPLSGRAPTITDLSIHRQTGGSACAAE